ncbi:unnamed protein product [Schistosoma curassoni]|uniref:Uncharacterized protein n=1 Tax=Schistosoma curassoni TaxID=6186 RepID=A0A183JF06_9TREM|nr:unnamed protein product [Schistosoma curassoni]
MVVIRIIQQLMKIQTNKWKILVLSIKNLIILMVALFVLGYK